MFKTAVLAILLAATLARDITTCHPGTNWSEL